MGLLDSLGKAAGWLKDSPVGQVIDVAFSPVEEDSQIKEIADAITRFTPVGDVRDVILPSVGKTFEGLDRAWDQGTRPFTTLNLQAGRALDGEFGKFVSPGEWKRSWRESDEMTLAQAAVSEGLLGFGQRTGAQLGAKLRSPKEREEFYAAQPWLRPDFDVTDAKQRNLAFRENFFGKMQTGTYDLIARWYFDPANIATFGGARLVRL